MVLKEDGTLGIISKISKYGVNAASSSCPQLLFFLFFLSVNRGPRITQQDYSLKGASPRCQSMSIFLLVEGDSGFIFGGSMSIVTVANSYCHLFLFLLLMLRV